jgi:hypothetical protein
MELDLRGHSHRQSLCYQNPNEWPTDDFWSDSNAVQTIDSVLPMITEIVNDVCIQPLDLSKTNVLTLDQSTDDHFKQLATPTKFGPVEIQCQTTPSSRR